MSFKTIAFAATIALSAWGGEARAADIINACAADVSTYCDAVEPGHGRLLSCLYAHETVISEACQEATGDMADLLDMFFEGTRVVQQQCSGDIRSLCGEIDPGEGRIFSCLDEHRAELSDGCKGVMETVKLPEN